jgi:hypothetical protein
MSILYILMGKQFSIYMMELNISVLCTIPQGAEYSTESILTLRSIKLESPTLNSICLSFLFNTSWRDFFAYFIS